MGIFEETLRHIHDWSVDRIHYLCESEDIDDAHSIQKEFKEWLDPTIEDHEIYSMRKIKK